MKITTALALSLILLLPGKLFAIQKLRHGEELPSVSLQKGMWKSESVLGKVTLIVYVDPASEKENAHVFDALARENFPEAKFKSYAIINMDNSWIPDFIISARIRQREKKYPRTVFIQDKGKKLVQKWGLKEKASNLLVLNSKGKLIYHHHGKLGEEELVRLINLIKHSLVHFH